MIDVFVDAVLAGLKTDDHLIEINGENIENIGDDQVKQRIRAVQYPQPLQLLVADQATYERYKRQGQPINSGLPNVRRLPGTVVERSVSFSRIRQGLFFPHFLRYRYDYGRIQVWIVYPLVEQRHHHRLTNHQRV